MSSARRVARFVAAAMVGLCLFASTPTAHAGAGIVQVVREPEAAETSTTEPATTEPETSEPESTEPDTSEPVVGDDDASDVLTAMAVVAFGVLVAVAGWWMVRRDDEDGAMYPRPRNGASSGTDLL